MEKSGSAFRTIGELTEETGIPQHILRYWERRFPQLRPLQRAGNRRYYRPEDVALVRRIQHLLGQEGYTVKGVQKVLAAGDAAISPKAVVPTQPESSVRPDRAALLEIRERLVAALEMDARASP